MQLQRAPRKMIARRYKEGTGSMAFLFDHEVFEDTDASPWGP